MQPADVYDLVGVGDPRISPDGKLVAYVVTSVDTEESTYRSAIWIVPTDGSQAPRRFSQGPKRDASPRWSPDGTRLAFVSNRDTDAGAQLYVIPAEGGEALQLTDLGKESVDEPTWSPDGTRIAFSARVRDPSYDEEKDRKRAPRHIKRLKYRLDSVGWTFDRPRHLFVVPADGSSEPKQVTTGDYENANPAWSPDGTEIAFVSARHRNWDIDPGTNDIFIIAATGSKPERVTDGDGRYGSPVWSADATRLAHTHGPGDEGTKHTQISVTDLVKGGTRILTKSLDRNCSPFMAAREPIWLGAKLLFALEDSGNNALYTVNASGRGKPEQVLGGDISLKGYDITGGVGVHVQSTPTDVGDLWCGDKRLTNHGKPFARERSLSKPTRFYATSPDGSKVEAWIMKPAGFKAGRKYPVLLNIHGGPFTQYGNTFFDEFQVYAAAGYVVLYCNPRGSSGYSEAWGAAINGPSLGGYGWGTVDYEDIMAVVDTALDRYAFCDPKKLGVMGGSYGGYMTSWIVSHTDRFKAALSERAVNAWHSMNGSSDIGWVFQAQFGTQLHDDPDGWTKWSPITYVKNIKTPLMIMHSENDLRCPIEQAEQLFTILRLLKRDVEFVRFPAESHELSRSGSPIHRVQRFEIVLDWFDRKLKR
jgi:dipeptidyl aminopeptidase/acylaminoacyl peptidase